jgi:hypothetical protein
MFAGLMVRGRSYWERRLRPKIRHENLVFEASDLQAQQAAM